MKPAAVAFVVTGLDVGGAEGQVTALALGFRRRGWRVAVVSLLPAGTYADLLERNEVAVHSLGMRRGIPDPRALFRLVRFLRGFMPDVVHAHMVHANLLARLARPFVSHAALISTAHNMDEGGRWRERAYRVTDRLTDLTTNVSRAAVSRYVAVGAVPPGRIAYVPNGIDTSRFRAGREKRADIRTGLGITAEFVWLTAGRFDAQKDYPTLLRAFASSIEGHHGRAVLLLAGEGALRPDMAALAHDLGIDDVCRFLGFRGDLAALMSAADGFVLASAWEGLPMVLLEAAAAGLPIVATDVGGNAEVVTDGQNGFLVAPLRSEALAAAMRKLTQLPASERQRMGEHGRFAVEERFALESVMDRWEELYDALVARRSRRAPAARVPRETGKL